MLGSRCLQCSLDGTVEISAGVGAETDETLHELALAIEDECLGNGVLVRKQKGDKIFVGSREWVLDAKLFCESRHELFVAWSTDV